MIDSSQIGRLASEVKKAAAERWVDAVNADGTYGRWAYTLVKKTTVGSGTIKAAAE